MIGFWNITPQVFADAVALGAVYALMAVGIGLVFGVLRLVNFAYGQLVMAGAFGLALASEWGWPLWAGIVLCFAVVLALSLAMDYLVFRPLRGRTPAVMLVATFAIAFLLQSIALVWFGPQVGGLLSTEGRGESLKLRTKEVNGTCGASVIVVESWPVTGLARTLPTSRTSTP